MKDKSSLMYERHSVFTGKGLRELQRSAAQAGEFTGRGAHVQQRCHSAGRQRLYLQLTWEEQTVGSK